MNWSSKQISIQPAVRPSDAKVEEVQTIQNDKRGIMMKRPKDLCILWHKYEFGSTDRLKPAKVVTSAQRDRNKFAYDRRKTF